jgi:hypothetical protein
MMIQLAPLEDSHRVSFYLLTPRRTSVAMSDQSKFGMRESAPQTVCAMQARLAKTGVDCED